MTKYVKINTEKNTMDHKSLKVSTMKQILPILITTALFLFPTISRAQIYQPSNRSAGADNSQIGTQISGTKENFNITGGLQRGRNLFHSFTDFSVPKDGSANFTNPAGNQSIITRVTGNLFSDINGLVNTNGANFLLINPNGVVFGTNAKLNVGKAFVTSTASGVDFVDAAGRNYNFGVNKAGDTPLLSIDPNIAFNPARLIMNASIPGNKGIENYGILATNNPGQYIGLIGGNVAFNGGKIEDPGGRVELGGLTAPGTVGLGIEGNLFRAQLPTNVARGDVSFTNGARVNVAGAGGGDIAINARNLEILSGSVVRGGMEIGLGTLEAVSGDIKVNATGRIIIGSNSAIANNVRLNSQGKGGNIAIEATDSISLQGSRAALQTATEGIGKAGNLEIKTRDLSVTNGAEIQASIKEKGKGDAGNIKITAKAGNVYFNNSAILSEVELGTEGKGGSIEIETGNLSVTNNARLSTSTNSIGDAGNIKIIATGNSSVDSSSVLSIVRANSTGKGGRIEIETGNLSVTNGGQLNALTLGKGDAGNIKVIAKSGSISFDGGRDTFRSAILNTVETGGEGKAGEIEIETRDLSLTNGAQLQTSIRGKGAAGNIKITGTRNVSFDGVQTALRNGVQTNIRTSVGSAIQPGGEGKGGSIEINTPNLSVTNGAALSASTSGKGDAGSIKITANNGKVSFDGGKARIRSTALSSVTEQGEGKGGEIEIVTGNLSVTNGAQLSTSTSGKGDGGNIVLNAKTIDLNKGLISLRSSKSTGGNLDIITQNYLLLRNNGLVATDSSSTDRNGNGGNITINSPLIIATPGNNDITANANQGNGGKVKIDSQGLFGIQYRPQGSPFANDITASSTFGQSGSVQIDTPGTDPGKNKGELAAAPNDASKQISQACGASQRDNKLYITGRGGLPPNASEPLQSEALWEDARAVKTQPAPTATQPQQFTSPAIGWVFEPNGRVRLIAAQTGVESTGTRVVCPK
jgi:filamentous hemagglutinin family protein